MRPKEKKNVTLQEAISTESMANHGDDLLIKLQRRQQTSKYKDTIIESPTYCTDMHRKKVILTGRGGGGEGR